MTRIVRSPQLDGEVFDWRAAVQPLIDAVPGSAAVACCGKCGRTIDGPAELYGNGFVCHPGECPPAGT